MNQCSMISLFIKSTQAGRIRGHEETMAFQVQEDQAAVEARWWEPGRNREVLVELNRLSMVNMIYGSG